MMRFYDRNLIDSAGIVIYQNGNAYDRGREKKDTGQYDQKEEIFGACAGAAMYRRKMLDEIGLFDEEYFAYFEDVDISFRMHLFGWKCIYVPEANVYHIHSATSKVHHRLRYSILKGTSSGICGNIFLYRYWFSNSHSRIFII